MEREERHATGVHVLNHETVTAFGPAWMPAPMSSPPAVTAEAHDSGTNTITDQSLEAPSFVQAESL
jgi:hypothetical protein